ncbi:type VII secretion protein EccB [Streptomyces griseoluteus]|uniref:type VII secretion protein EccB n=1 Tax=Streptomyces griseoluteus TaxID=29306 RepID=UPI0037F379AE
MQTRRDHLQAYRFAMGRLATALVTGDPGRGEGPHRRTALGSFLGACLVVLLCLGFLVYGWLAPVDTQAWRRPGVLVVEKETGNRYFYLHGKLRPVRNYASARLIAGGEVAVVTVLAAALGGVPHGAPVGIEGAPDGVPTPRGLLGGVWSECLRPDLPGGRVLDFAPGRRVAAFPTGRQVLLRDPRGRRYVLWRGIKYPVPSDATLIALGLDGDLPVAAPLAWLEAVPTGAALTAEKTPGEGRAAGRIAGRSVSVGQLFSTSGSGTRRWYVMTSDGVAGVNATEAALLAARPGAKAPREVAAADIATARVSGSAAPGTRLPDLVSAPAVRTSAQAVCLRRTARDTGYGATVVVESGAAAAGRAAVLVPPSHGVYAVDQKDVAAGVYNPAAWLITDRGVAYRLGDSAAADLGIADGAKTTVSRALIATVPQGPVLDRRTAAVSVPETTPKPAAAARSTKRARTGRVRAGSGTATAVFTEEGGVTHAE